MTNETTASQPKVAAPDENHMDAMRELVSEFRKAAFEFGQGGNPDDHSLMMRLQQKLFVELRAVGSQPKSIGDERYEKGYGGRAPAAQASATIQTAPDLFGFSREELDDVACGYETEPKTIDVGSDGRHVESGSAYVARFIRAALAATIQEPVMVAEPVGLTKPCGWLAGNSSDGGEMMYWKREAAQSECDQHNTYERSRPDFNSENLREPEPVYAAPMVADPAGVALPINATIRAVISKIAGDSGEGWCAKDEEDCWAELCAAATVKAVPSEALEAQANAIMGFARALVDMGFEPRDSIVKFAGECADLARTRKVLSADDFAARLADKTGDTATKPGA